MDDGRSSEYMDYEAEDGGERKKERCGTCLCRLFLVTRTGDCFINLLSRYREELMIYNFNVLLRFQDREG